MARHISWKLEDWLAAHGRTRYQLAAAMGGNRRSNLTTLYRHRVAERIDYHTLERIIEGLEQLTGETVAVCDLLEYRRE